jgi:hypothetical protein
MTTILELKKIADLEYHTIVKATYVINYGSL